MKVQWTEIINTPDVYMDEEMKQPSLPTITYTGTLVGCVAKLGSTFLVVACTDGKFREVSLHRHITIFAQP